MSQVEPYLVGQLTYDGCLRADKSESVIGSIDTLHREIIAGMMRQGTR